MYNFDQTIPWIKQVGIVYIEISYHQWDWKYMDLSWQNRWNHKASEGKPVDLGDYSKSWRPCGALLHSCGSQPTLRWRQGHPGVEDEAGAGWRAQVNHIQNISMYRMYQGIKAWFLRTMKTAWWSQDMHRISNFWWPHCSQWHLLLFFLII